MRSIPHAGKKCGITVLELLICLAIIAIVTASALPAYHRARNRAAIVKTASIIASLEAALSMYQTDMGDYPGGDGTGSAALVESLMGPVNDPLWKGPYMRFKQADIDAQKNILDTWKKPITYRYPQDIHRNVPFIIVSPGPDRQFDTPDDIGNW